MPELVDRETRSRMMSGIRGTDTKPEITIRKVLHSKGYRYRLHDRKLPGRPDLVLAKYKTIIHIHGCFWHLHECHLFKWPATRQEFWKNKLTGNRQRDEENYRQLSELGWKQLIIWECALKGKQRKDTEEITFLVEQFLLDSHKECIIQGNKA